MVLHGEMRQTELCHHFLQCEPGASRWMTALEMDSSDPRCHLKVTTQSHVSTPVVPSPSPGYLMVLTLQWPWRGA